jgi:hypothetical protein
MRSKNIMDEIITSELKKTKSSVASASVEKTLEYETAEGKVSERSTVGYNVDKGNAIDNIVNTVTESKSVQKAGSFINKTIRLGLSGGGGIIAGLSKYRLDVDKHRHRNDAWTNTSDFYIWDVPEWTIIVSSILAGLIVFSIIFTIYSKIFMKK